MDKTKQEKNGRFIRRPEFDRRIAHGDDFAGDAWEDTTRTVNGGSWCAVSIVYTAVGIDPNTYHKKEEAAR